MSSWMHAGGYRAWFPAVLDLLSFTPCAHALVRAIEDMADARRWTALTKVAIALSGVHRRAAAQFREEVRHRVT